jgi:hypothetical protein
MAMVGLQYPQSIPEFIFHLILMGLFFNEFHKKNPFQKNAVLLYKYYHFGIKGTKKDFISV